MGSFFKHVADLFVTPVETFKALRDEGWVAPVASVLLSVAVLASIPFPSPDKMLGVLKMWAALKVSQAVAMWLAGLPQGGRGTLSQVVRVVAFLSVVDGAMLFGALRMPPLLFLIQLIIPLLYLLAVKGVHEYQHDGLAFRVTLSAMALCYMIYNLLMSRIGMAGAVATLLP